jgi:protein-S-isoprenylcysteine O-methyltransferase Ste14
VLSFAAFIGIPPVRTLRDKVTPFAAQSQALRVPHPLIRRWYWGVGVVLAGAYFIYSATAEARIMERLFPETYPTYKRSTKMLIPFVF